MEFIIKEIKDICDVAHSYDAMMYYDGANMNAIMGVAKPGDIGFDVIHINVHKTFATPHGGGGPGSGPVGVNEKLLPFLPDLGVKKVNNKYELTDGGSETIGKISPFFWKLWYFSKSYYLHVNSWWRWYV